MSYAFDQSDELQEARKRIAVMEAELAAVRKKADRLQQTILEDAKNVDLRHEQANAASRSYVELRSQFEAAKAENARLAAEVGGYKLYLKSHDAGVAALTQERDKLRAALEAVLPVIAMVLKHREATMPEVVSKLMAAFEELGAVVGNALGGGDA